MPKKGFKCSEEMKSKLAKKARERIGEKNGFFGKHHSDETKEKIRNAKIGKQLSEEHKKKIAEAGIGRRHTEETLIKLRENHVGMLGRRHSAETLIKFSETRVGENNSNWKPEKTDEERLLDGILKRDYPEYQKWRLQVFDRDNFTCQKCGCNKSGSLNAHHIEGYTKNVDLRTIVENGITFCKTCHKDFHRQYGIESTAEKVNEFMGRGH